MRPTCFYVLLNRKNLIDDREGGTETFDLLMPSDSHDLMGKGGMEEGEGNFTQNVNVSQLFDDLSLLHPLRPSPLHPQCSRPAGFRLLLTCMLSAITTVVSRVCPDRNKLF